MGGALYSRLRRRLPDNIDVTKRGRDIVATAHKRPRGVCTEIEVPGGLSGEALMTMERVKRRLAEYRQTIEHEPSPEPETED